MSRRLIAVLLVALPLALLGCPADAAWTTPPGNLSAAGASAVDAVTAVGPNGHVALAWRRMDAAGDWRIQLRVRSDTGALGATQTVSPAGESAYAPDVAVDATGRVVIVWSQRDDPTGAHRVLAKTRSAAGALSGIKILSSGVGTGDPLSQIEPQVELDAAGTAVVAWGGQFSGYTRAVTRSISAAGALAPTWQTLSGDGVNSRPVALAIDDSGTATVAWARYNGVDTRIEARTRTVGGSLGALKVLTPSGQDDTAPEIAVTPTGDAVVAWVRYDTADQTLYARRLTAAGALGPVKTISAVGKDVADDTVTGWGEVGVGDNGDAVLAWQQAKPCCSQEVAVRGMSAAGTLSATTNPGTGNRAFDPQLAVSPAGDALVVFTQRDDSFWDRTVVRDRSAAGVFGTLQTLSAVGRDADYPDLAMNDSGLAVSTWVRADSSDPSCCNRAQYAVGP